MRLLVPSLYLLLLYGIGVVAPCFPDFTPTVFGTVNITEYELPFGPNRFAPANARTTTNQFIGQSEFIPAERCAGCHQSVHTEWKESAHRNSFREPFYQANVKHLIRDRGIAVTRHCESCHNPVALFSGALSANARMARPFDEEGVSCSVCHSIEATTTQGRQSLQTCSAIKARRW